MLVGFLSPRDRMISSVNSDSKMVFMTLRRWLALSSLKPGSNMVRVLSPPDGLMINTPGELDSNLGFGDA